MKKTYSELIEYYENVSPREIIADMYFDYKEEIDNLNNLGKQLVEENEELKSQLQQKENIIKEVRESAKRELKIAEENIKNSEQWLDVEEEQEHAKRDIHTGKVVKRYMEMFLEILDKENK